MNLIYALIATTQNHAPLALTHYLHLAVLCTGKTPRYLESLNIASFVSLLLKN